VCTGRRSGRAAALLDIGAMNVDARRGADVIEGCEAWSHVGRRRSGALVLHGFTGAPASVRNVAEALAGAGHHVELPRLPGHGTSIDDMLGTTWHHWFAEALAAHDRLAERAGDVVVVGQSMGATLALSLALARPQTRALVCINPLTRPRGSDVIEMIDDYLDDDIRVAPGEGSDIADPDGSDISYPGTPLAQLRSLLVDGVAPIAGRLGELTMPLRLFTSRQDHVVEPADSEHLAAVYAGDVEHTWLERSYHVATRDFDRDIVIAGTIQFVERVSA
jgi:carboxylesterase